MAADPQVVIDKSLRSVFGNVIMFTKLNMLNNDRSLFPFL